MRKDYIIGVDLAKRYDRTAITVLERTPLPNPPAIEDGAPDEDPLLLRCVYCHQPPQRTAYQKIAEFCAQLIEHPKLKGRVNLVLDMTGVGDGVKELFDQLAALDGLVWTIVITPGQRVNKRPDMAYTVPKKDLVDAVLIALQRKRLFANPNDPWDMEVLRKQMFAFKRKIDPRTMQVSLESIDESVHDDACLSLCLAVWLSTQIPLEDQGEWGSGNEPHILLPGAQAIPRFADTWRPTDDPSTHRSAGPGMPGQERNLPPRPEHPRPQ